MECKVLYLDEAHAFLSSLDDKVREKIIYNVGKVENGILDKKLFKKLSGTEIWEFRTLYQGNYYRLLAFWDTEEGAFIIATHGFIKKTDKTPPKEIARAETIRTEYFNDKKL